MIDQGSRASTTDLAASITPGDGVVVHRRPLTVVATTTGEIGPLADSLSLMVDALIRDGELDFGPVAAGLQRCVVEHQPAGVAAVLDVSPDPIAFLFDQARADGPSASHQASGRSGWTTVFIEEDRLTLSVGRGTDRPYAQWTRLEGGTVGGLGAHVALVRSLPGMSGAASATEDLLTRTAVAQDSKPIRAPESAPASGQPAAEVTSSPAGGDDPTDHRIPAAGAIDDQTVAASAFAALAGPFSPPTDGTATEPESEVPAAVDASSTTGDDQAQDEHLGADTDADTNTGTKAQHRADDTDDPAENDTADTDTTNTTAQVADPGEAQHTDPGEAQHTDPGDAQHTDPGDAQHADPADPGDAAEANDTGAQAGDDPAGEWSEPGRPDETTGGGAPIEASAVETSERPIGAPDQPDIPGSDREVTEAAVIDLRTQVDAHGPPADEPATSTPPEPAPKWTWPPTPVAGTEHPADGTAEPQPEAEEPPKTETPRRPARGGLAALLTQRRQWPTNGPSDGDPVPNQPAFDGPTTGPGNPPEAPGPEPIAGPPPMPGGPPRPAGPATPPTDQPPPTPAPGPEPIAGPPPMPGGPPRPAGPATPATDQPPPTPAPGPEPIAGPPPMPGGPPRSADDDSDEGR